MFPPPIRALAFAGCIGLGCSLAGFFVGRATAELSRPTSSSQSDPAARLPIGISPSATTVTAPHSATALPLNPEDWRTLLAAPSSPSTEQTLLSSLRALAASDPARALDLAQSASTPRQRDAFIRALLQGWGAADPQAAARWTLANVRLGERRVAVESLLEGAIDRPEEALAATTYLCTTDPLLQSDHGQSLITALSRAGRFDLATRFAATGPGDFRAYWLSTAFSQWAVYQPSAAIDAASKLTDSTARTEALQGVIAGWASSNPAALVAHAEKLPPGHTRASALRDGLQQWVSLDPVAASTWMDRLDPSPDLDAGAAAVATTPVIVAKKPDVATSWAESIVDPQLRADTLLDLIRLWATTDPAAARHYASTTAALRAETRAVALASFQQDSSQILSQ